MLSFLLVKNFCYAIISIGKMRIENRVVERVNMDNKKKLIFVLFGMLGIAVIGVVVYFVVGFYHNENKNQQMKKPKQEDKTITYVKEYCMSSYPIKDYGFEKETIEDGTTKVHVTKDGKETFYYIVDLKNPTCNQVWLTESIKSTGAGEKE